MPHAAERTRTLSVALVAALILVTALPIGVLAHDPPRQRAFMYAIGEVESGGRYEARNPHSGAIGKYQIMPSNWRAWARLYLGDPNARPTPRNQEIVAGAKFRGLHHWLRSWVLVAHWWLTGSSSRDVSTWSAGSVHYVRRVMAIYRQAGGVQPPRPHARPRPRTIGDASRSIVYRGGWQRAGHSAYSADTVRYASRPGASAGLSFVGRSVTWIGPKGPTRGRARVFIDGRLVRTVDLRSIGFVARAAVFAHAWRMTGRHTIRIEVVGTPGRPMVAIDELVVRS